MKRKELLEDYRSKKVSELEEIKLDLLSQLFNIRMQKGAGQLNQNHLFKEIKRNIARVNQLISDKNNIGV